MSNRESERAEHGARTSHVRKGQTWSMNESRANPDDVPEPHDVELWADQPSFKAVVDGVVDGVAELTVATGNDHPRTPDFGEKVDIATDSMINDPRWRVT